MDEDVSFLDTFKDDVLDDYLAKGWYRSLSLPFMFTTDNIHIDKITYPVYWIRYNVSSIVLSSNQRRLMNTVRKKYSISYEPLNIEAELERIFCLYKKVATFLTADSLWYIFGNNSDDTFNTEVIKIGDGNELIAAGLFDKGNNSISGVMNFYDPAYRKYSLGKYLVLEKISYCLSKGIRYYYPGYIAPGVSKLDYKLFIDNNAIEVYDFETRTWIPYFEWRAHCFNCIKQYSK